MSKGLLAVLLSILMVLVASGMLVSAADAAVPGDWMYSLDRAMDGLRLQLALDNRQKAYIERQLAQERLREAQILVRRGDTEYVELLRQESRLAMQAAKAANPHFTRKTEKPTGKTLLPTLVQQKGQHLERVRPGQQDPTCSMTAAKQLPGGAKLAQRLAVNYSDVLGWYCRGYGLGEIGLAYRISRVANVTVDDVFAQRLNGLDWGKIIQNYKIDGKEEQIK